MDLLKRKIKMFRCHYDPIIGPTPKNAFKTDDPETCIEEAEITPAGVYVKTKPNRNKEVTEHLIPYANIQSILLFPEVKVELKDDKAKEKVILGQKVKAE